MSKNIKAIPPYIWKGQINFKYKPYDAWSGLELPTAKSHYPPRFLHFLAYKYDLPKVCKSRKEARLGFAQPYSLAFDTFPDYMFYEIIPFLWDVWPSVFDKTIQWLKKHEVKTAIFTSSQVADRVKEIFPDMNILAVTEGIDIEPYKKGRNLADRETEILQYGREIDAVVKYDFSNIRYVSGKDNGKIVFTQEQLYDAIADAKVVAAYPKSWTNPEEAGGIETLTQRYWECMLSRCVMIGHAPKELTDLLGYNPVIELDQSNPDKQLRDVLDNIENYQTLVDKNREMALKYGDWRYSMNKVAEWLISKGYKLK